MSMSGRRSEHTEIMHKEEEFYIYSFNKAKRPMKIMYFLSPHPKLNYKTLSNNCKPDKVHPLLQIISILRNSILTAHELNHVCEHFYKAEWCNFSDCRALRFSYILSSLQLIFKLVNTDTRIPLSAPIHQHCE